MIEQSSPTPLNKAHSGHRREGGEEGLKQGGGRRGAGRTAAHGEGGEAVLEDLLEAQELDDGEGDGRVEAQASLVGPDGLVELHAVPAVHLRAAAPPPALRQSATPSRSSCISCLSAEPAHCLLMECLLMEREARAMWMMPY